MSKLLLSLIFIFLMIFKINGQSIDNLQLTEKEIPENYSLTTENNCISIQACTFYQNPEMYSMLIGKLKTKKVQNFESKKDKGCIMYFEFEDAFQGQTFLDGLLWGGNRPTKEHPEEYYAKDNFLIIWSFKKGSLITQISKEKK